MTETRTTRRTRTADEAMRERSKRVIPNGMYGHMSVNTLPSNYPQFYERSEGSHTWDVDGNEYVDLMCSFGPNILGYGHPRVEEAAAKQRLLGDTQPGPSARIVELAELLVERVSHAEWAMFAKNGTDATTLCLTVARAATGREKVLSARGAYHGIAGWNNPNPVGFPASDHSDVFHYRFNDLDSLEQAFQEAGPDEVAAVFVSSFRHDAGFDQEIATAEFVRGLREKCDTYGAALILDEVRAGFRLNDGGSWEQFGIEPDLSAWSKAIANGYPLAAALGTGKFRSGAERIFATGSFWYQAVPMAAAIATIKAIRDEGAIASMEARGSDLRAGIAEQASAAGVSINQSGPVQLPNLSFQGDEKFERALLFGGTAAAHGLIIHPRHNWFLSAAHTEADIARALEATAYGFQAVVEQFGKS